MLQRPYVVGENARLLAAEAGGPQFIHAFDSPSKRKSDDAQLTGSSATSVMGRSGLLALLNRRLDAWCKRLGPTVALWLTAAAICAVFLLIERPPSADGAVDLGGEQLGGAVRMGASHGNAAFTDLGDGLPEAKASFVRQPGNDLVGTAARDPPDGAPGGVQQGEGTALSYFPDLSSYLPDLSAAYQNYTMVAADPNPRGPSGQQP